MIRTFSKKEAILHGFNMTKKYFGLTFSILVIYVAFELAVGQLEYFAGPDQMAKSDVRLLYKDRTIADNFYSYLVDSGYLSKWGLVQEKLEYMKDTSELSLPDAFKNDQERIYQFLQAYTYRLPFPKAVYYMLSVILWVLYMLLHLGLIKISLMLSRDQGAEISMLYSNGPLLIAYILATIGYVLAVLGGMVLLIVPGVIFAIALGMYPYFIVDKQMAPMEALKASRTLTKGARWQLFCFGLLLGLLNLGGLLCLLIGLLWTIPTSCIAMAYVYDQLAGHTYSSPATDGNTYAN